ncbi:hypothetical protein G6O67_007274 [Ophiocordyceps sinensis]|uniref:Uncharacterized protein n=1 Tax=Ophiocordyceps sinensis TaxID=72228 RepID=A0A8H4PIQ9_9HYPO|nr:hypothetical protein G6O67_007274 [Ophiocordyceps sinensis]
MLVMQQLPECTPSPLLGISLSGVQCISSPVPCKGLQTKHWQINPDLEKGCYPAIAELQTWAVVCCNLAADIHMMAIPEIRRLLSLKRHVCSQDRNR